ncbi:unnamed protein product [Dovyalis caffra]|uniref:GIR1-like zinc ribbon domain-containing protein n=1 Tax=Dovyalis caffra TaxID=77055 RepID=A0AAV1SUF2_9ROSI|nr:unnamed protein product [Dovyalis caffra]
MMNSTSNSEILTTKDLLGGFSKVGNKDLDLELQITKSWDVPVDSKSSGKVYLQRCNSVSSPLPSLNNKKHRKQRTTQESEFQDSKSPPLKFLEESCLELKLVPSINHCQSVCTLDKVKSALQRAEKETMTKKRSPPPPPTPTPPANDVKEDEISTTSSSSIGVFAAACPGCLLYVIALKTNPKCPSCNSTVPSPSAIKKPRIDLNASL